MRLTELIGPDRVVLGIRAADKAQVLQELAKRASAQLTIEPGVIAAALAARERLGSTGFGRGFALPHVRLDGLKGIFALLVRLAKPVDFESIDGKPVDVLVMLLIPSNGGSEHVAALAAVSRSMRDEANLKAIRKAGNAAALVEALAHAESDMPH